MNIVTISMNFKKPRV